MPKFSPMHRSVPVTAKALLIAHLVLACSRARPEASLADAGIDEVEAPQVSEGEPPVDDSCRNPAGSVIVNEMLNPIAALKGCTEIGGDLIIQRTDLTDLSGLESLRAIRGRLVINGNKKLASLRGLDHLVEVTGDVQIGGFFQFVDDPWTGTDNPSLVTVAGLESLTTIGGSLQIRDARSLAFLDGLSGLKEVGQDVAIGNTGLVSLRGLETLERIGGRLTITSNEYLGDITGLVGLREIAGQRPSTVTSEESSLSIHQNLRLPTLDGLEGLRTIHGEVVIRDNEALRSLEGLAGLERVEGTLSIIDAPSLSSLGGLNNLISIGGLVIASVPRLETIDALQGLRGELPGTIEIRNAPLLKDLTGLEGVTGVVGRLGVFSSRVSSLHGLENVSAAGELVLSDLVYLKDLDALLGLSRVNGNVQIINTAIANLDGLSALHGVMKGALIISRNGGLHNLDGLRAITAIEGEPNVGQSGRRASLEVSHNNYLMSLSGLSALVSVSGPLIFRGNGDLACQTRALARRLGKVSTEECDCEMGSDAQCGI